MMRQCQKCGEVKPLCEFRMEPRIKSGHLWKCRTCEADDDRKWMEKTIRDEGDLWLHVIGSSRLEAQS